MIEYEMTDSLLMLAIKCSAQASTLALQTRKQNEHAKQEKTSKSDFWVLAQILSGITSIVSSEKFIARRNSRMGIGKDLIH